MFPCANFLESFYRKWMLNFIKTFFCIYWNKWNLLFSLLMCGVSHWFAGIEKSLHLWDKSHLIMRYDPFNVLLDSVCSYFVEDFFTYGISTVVLACHFLFVWYLCLVLVSRSCWLHRMSLGVFLPLQVF